MSEVPMGRGIQYKVRVGDTLWDIASQYGVSVEDLKKANSQIKDFSLIKPGDIITIPASEKIKGARSGMFKAQAANPPIKYTVEEKETLADIAEKYDVKLADLKAVNSEIKPPFIIKPGDIINIPAYGKLRPKRPPLQLLPRLALSNVKMKYIEYGDGLKFGKNIALTFDDGPDPNNTPVILDVLKEFNEEFENRGLRISAVFFVNGIKVRRHPELIQRIVREGHTLGNHTYDHPIRPSRDKYSQANDITELTEEQMIKQITDTQSAVNDALKNDYPDGYPMKKFRCPGLHFNDKLLEAARKAGITEVIHCNSDSKDYNNPGPEQIRKNIYGELGGGGGVLLFHEHKSHCIEETLIDEKGEIIRIKKDETKNSKDGEPENPKEEKKPIRLLKRIITRLKEDGYNFVTVDDLLKMKDEYEQKRGKKQKSKKFNESSTSRHTL